MGTELLLGEIVDTNSAYIAQQLTTVGVDLHFKSTVGDNLERIKATLRTALARSDFIITTGGIGPTLDDLTREAVSEALNRPLRLPAPSFRTDQRFLPGASGGR